MRLYHRCWQTVLLVMALGLALLLAGCTDAPPTPTPLFATATTAAQDLDPGPTDTRVPSPTPARIHGPTPTPTWTLAPTLTPSPTGTPTPTPSPTMTPSPTPQPSVQLEAALRYQTNGDYDQAIAAYLAVLDDEPTPDQAREARYRLAESYLQSQDYAGAIAAWEDFIAAYPDDVRLPQARLMAARAYRAANDCAGAIPYYKAYVADVQILADLVYRWIGDCQAQGGEWEEAIAAYRKALAAATDRIAEVNSREKIAGVHLAMGAYSDALAEYDAILAVARDDEYRSRIEYLAGQALAADGQIEAAYARYHRVVDGHPETEHAYLSLVELVDAGVEVDEFQRGLVDYHAGAIYPDAYGAALRAFDRYLAGQSPDQADAALYYKALTQRAIEQPQAALETLEALITGYPESNWLARAWFQKGTALAAMGRNDAAVKAYQDLAAFFPADELAPEALGRAARLREGAGMHTEAARLYEQIQANFPGFRDADEALWLAGLAHYRAGDFETAVIDWQALVGKYPSSPYRPKSLYWLGKLGATDESQDQDYWDQLVAADPHAYYALRVEQIRTGSSLTATRLITAAVEPPDWNAARAEAEILAWLRGWTQVPTDTDRLTLPGAISQRSDFRRGEALLAGGLRREAIGAFDSVRAAAWQNPLQLAQLSLFFRERGLYGLASRTASRVAGLWPEGTIHESPVELQRLAYPLVYADLLSARAQERNLDPLLLAALVRQESLFEPVAVSYAGARGLGQVMPATGTGIASTLGMKDFTLDDLYRPSVGIRFGAFYLGVQMDRFGDRILVALAAYNGGPGNTLSWQEAGGDDLDLFVESITATQSRLYLQRVYEQYLVYERLYR